MTILVTNLNAQTTEANLRKAFEVHGVIESVTAVENGFKIKMANEDKAITKLNNTTLDGSVISVANVINVRRH